MADVRTQTSPAPGGDEQLDIIQHPVLGEIGFPKSMPVSQRNQSLDDALANHPMAGFEKVDPQASIKAPGTPNLDVPDAASQLHINKPKPVADLNEFAPFTPLNSDKPNPGEGPQGTIDRAMTRVATNTDTGVRSFFDMKDIGELPKALAEVPKRARDLVRTPPSETLKRMGGDVQDAAQSAGTAIQSKAEDFISDPVTETAGLLPAAAVAYLTKRLTGKLPTGEQTEGRLLNAVGPEAENAEHLKNIAPLLDAAKKADTAPRSLEELPKWLHQTSTDIDAAIQSHIQARAGTFPAIGHRTQQIAQSVLSELDRFPQSGTGDVLARKATMQNIVHLANEIGSIDDIGELDKMRNRLNGELSTFMKKNNFNQRAILRDPANAFKQRALENIREVLADEVGKSAGVGAGQIRTLRSQQASLMKLEEAASDASESRSAQASATKEFSSGLSAPAKAVNTYGKIHDTVTKPLETVRGIGKSTPSGDRYVRKAFEPEGSNIGAAFAGVAANRLSRDKTSEEKKK